MVREQFVYLARVFAPVPPPDSANMKRPPITMSGGGGYGNGQWNFEVKASITF
jgi:hypothetical protein